MMKWWMMEGLGPHANYLAHRGQIEAWGHQFLPKNLMDPTDWKQLGRQFPHFQEVNSACRFYQPALTCRKTRIAKTSHNTFSYVTVTSDILNNKLRRSTVIRVSQENRKCTVFQVVVNNSFHRIQISIELIVPVITVWGSKMDPFCIL